MNNAEWTKSGVSVEREGKMKGATKIKDKILPYGCGEDRKKKSLGAMYESKSDVK